MRNKIFYFTVIFIFITSIAEAKISQKKYFSIFQKYNVNDNNTVQRIINVCVDKFGKNNIKIETNSSGEKILNHKNEKEFLDCTYQNILQVIKPIQGINSLKQKELEKFLLDNEIYINFGKGKETYIFKSDGYEKFQDGKKIGGDGWRWSKLKQLRVFMDGEKTTWRVSNDKMALSIKKGKDKPQYYFLEYKDKKIAEEDRKIAKKKEEEKKKAEAKRKEEERKKAEEQRIAEEKRKEEERLAEEKRKEEERLAEEKRKEEEKKKKDLEDKKLSLLKESELEKNQKFIKQVKKFINLNPNEFDVVEIAKFLIKVQTILDGELNDQNLVELDNLKSFARSSSKFVEYEENSNKKENVKKLQIIDNEIIKLTNNINSLEKFLINNLDSYYAKEIVIIIEKGKNTLENLNSLDEISDTQIKIENIIIKVEEFDKNLAKSNNLILELKNYLSKHMTSEISPNIISRIEIAELALNNPDPEYIIAINKEIENFIKNEITSYELKIAEEKRKEEERIAEEKRKEKERLAEEKRIEEEKKLEETFKKYKANSQFQKDFVRALLSIPDFDLKDIKFGFGDRQIEINATIFNQNSNSNEFIDFSGLKLKNINKNVFYKIQKSFENLEFDSSMFEEGEWFDEISCENFSFKIGSVNFTTKPAIKELEFKDFSKNFKLVNQYSDKLKINKDQINIISAVLSFSVDQLILGTRSSSLQIEDLGRSLSWDKFEISDFSLFDWGSWIITNYRDIDKNLNTETTYSYSDLNNVRFDKEEIIKIVQNFSNNFNLESDFKLILNTFESLGNGKTENILVKDLKTKNQIASAKRLSLNNFSFDYIDRNKTQKFITEFDFNLEGLDLNIQEISPEFSSTFNILGYDKVKFDFGTKYNLTRNNNLNFDIDLGITDAASIQFSSIFSGFDFNQISSIRDEAILAYLSTNFKIKEMQLLLKDNSLRNKLIRFAAQEQGVSEKEFKNTIINQIDSFSMSTQKTRLFNQYRKAVVNFINGSKSIKFVIMPDTPLSVMELTPYFLNPDLNLLIERLGIKITN